MSDDQDQAEYMYYPSDMLDDFKTINFDANGSSISISINCYRNNDAENHPAPSDGGTEDALLIKDALLSLDVHNVLARAGGAQSYVDVWTGKGSPKGIGAVMETLVDYSEAFIKKFGKTKGTQGKCAAWLADDTLSWEASMQAISDEYLGLDCNGFVGNWLKKCDHALKLGPQNGPRQVYNARKLTRTSVDQIGYADVVVWADFGHIAAIEGEAGAGSPKFMMCQSAGGGPRMNEYTISVSSPGKFRLAGGYPAGDVAGEVYIISPWST